MVACACSVLAPNARRTLLSRSAPLRSRMEQSCYKCGSVVEEGVPFCPQCSAPQIRVVIAEPVPAPLAFAAATSLQDSEVLPASQTVPVLALPMQWSEAFRPVRCLLSPAARIEGKSCFGSKAWRSERNSLFRYYGGVSCIGILCFRSQDEDSGTSDRECTEVGRISPTGSTASSGPRSTEDPGGLLHGADCRQHICFPALDLAGESRRSLGRNYFRSP